MICRLVAFRNRLLARLPVSSLARPGRPLRLLLAASVALAGAAIALGMGGGSAPSQHGVKRGSALLPAQAVGLRISAARGRATPRAAAAYYRRTARKRVTPSTPRAFLPLYREAARRFGVDWRLLASIHRQETAFSTAKSTYHGLNAFGCCAGPMQFNVTNGPVSTWKRYRQAFREGRRPRRYPHRTRRHPSIYDDFDAIMAAAWLLSDAGAGRSLDVSAWWAAYSYYGHDLFGVTYASQVLARAVGWQRDGFCPGCALDLSLVERFDEGYGAPVRRALKAADRKEKKAKKKAKKRKKRKSDRRNRERSAKKSESRASRRPRPRRPAPNARRKTVPADPAPVDPTPPPPTQTSPPAPPAATTPAPVPPPTPRCTPIEKLLGCR